MPVKTIESCYSEMPDDAESLPRISIVIPFEPKMNKKSELLKILMSAADKTENELRQEYPEEMVMPVIIKLRKLIKDIHYESHNKSIAFFVSPLTEKVYQFTHTDSLKNYYPLASG
ncbi:MAG: hypothetical protein Q8891_16455 [Bacteroidota bacterium]|nr:hypothetical protein [Bacteroidota bacterium]